MDGKRVRLFVVILGPADQPQPYLKLLASISRLLVNARLRRELLHASSAAAAHETCVRWSRITAPAVASKASVLLTVVLYEDQLLHPLLEHFVEMGVEGATILDSQGMNEYISQVPLYAEMIQFMSVRKSRSKTILAIIPDTRLDALIKGIEEITGNLDQVEGAVVYAQELCCVRGTMRMLE
jgi:nitrogen PTS system EIIA component